jgi:hypothetical protein
LSPRSIVGLFISRGGARFPFQAVQRRELNPDSPERQSIGIALVRASRVPGSMYSPMIRPASRNVEISNS